nr:NAD(P)H-binding protein [Bifidobacterium choerinum]
MHRDNELGADILDDEHVTVVTGDAKSEADVAQAIEGADAVYANLSGGRGSSEDIIPMAQATVAAMDKAGVRRLIWISSLGIYGEVPGEFGAWNTKVLGDYLTNYRKAADVIEASDLEYTIIRPAWLTDNDEVDFEVTEKGELFRGTEVSRKSVASEVVRLLLHPGEELRSSIGLDKPGTEGDRPSWMLSDSTEHLSE